MAEEVKDAGTIVPRSMLWSFVLNVPFTFGMVISYLYCMPSVEDAVSDPTGFPFVYVFRNATGSVGGTTGMTVVILFLITMITISAFASTSRQTFAFARDNGLPFSSWLGQVCWSYFISSRGGRWLTESLVGTREMAGPGELSHLHRYFYLDYLTHQHWKHGGLQCHAVPLHSRSDGHICHLYWLCHTPPLQPSESSTTGSLVSWTSWVAR